MPLIIRNWNEHFENARSRQLATLSWVPMPNKHDGAGYAELLDHPDGFAHYGCWCGIVQVASKCRPRGVLVTARGSDHTPESLARMLRGCPKTMREAIDRLLQIGWLEGITEASATTTLPSSVQVAPKCIEGKGREGKGKKGKDTTLSPGGDSPPPQNEFIEAWNALGKPFAALRTWSDKRQRMLKVRMVDAFFAANWKPALEAMAFAPFCRGENNRGWIADVDFFLRPDSAAKILEGKYNGGGAQRPNAGIDRSMTKAEYDEVAAKYENQDVVYDAKIAAEKANGNGEVEA